MTASSMDELDYSELDADASGGCCGSRDEGENAAVNAFRRVFRVLGIEQYASWVKGNPGLIAVNACALAFAAIALHVVAPTPPLMGAARACIFAVYATLGVPAFVDLVYNLCRLIVNISVLTTLAVFATVVIGSPVEGGLLLLLFEAAHIVEGKLTSAAKGDVTQLLRDAPESATLIDVALDSTTPTAAANNNGTGSNGLGAAPTLRPLHATERTVPVREVAIGEHVLVKAGQRVPLDGTIVFGRSMISSETITGESLPISKTVGMEVPAGAHSTDGAIVVRTLRTAEESTPMRIARMTVAAQERKPVIRQRLDKWIEIYSKCVLVMTLVVIVASPLVGGRLLGPPIPLLGPGGSFYRAAAFLTAAAPCALVMTPLAYIAAISAVARKGVILKGGRVLDALAECDTIALDKTGTLTEGNLRCTGIAAMAEVGGEGKEGKEGEEGEALGFRVMEPGDASAASSVALALALSQKSTHPVSNAIRDLCAKQSEIIPNTNGTNGASSFAANGKGNGQGGKGGGKVGGKVGGAQGGGVGWGCGDGMGVDRYKIDDFVMKPGYGVEARVSPADGSAWENGSSQARWVKFGSIEHVSRSLSEHDVSKLERFVKAQGQDRVVSVLLKQGPGGPATHGRWQGGAVDGRSGGLGANPAAPSSPSSSSSSSSSSASPTAAAAAAVETDETTLFMFADQIKPKSAMAIEALQTSGGLRAMMLTGDHETNARNVARAVGIEPANVFSGLLPDEKLSMVEEARRESKGRVAMAGDGVNDAPALAAADVGIAFAATTNAAAASVADAIVLQEGSEHVSVLPTLFKVARRTRQVVRQNVFLATVSIVGTSLPSLAGYIPLWLSVSMHEGSTLLVALNSLRLLLPVGGPHKQKPKAQRTEEIGKEDGDAGAVVGRKRGLLSVVLSVVALAMCGCFIVQATRAAAYGDMVKVFESASAGLFAGALHSLTGPDHLAALAPLSIGRSHLAAGCLGGLWGFGHSAGQFFFGALFVLLKSQLDVHLEMIEQFAGGAVGITLILIGFFGYKEARAFSFQEEMDGNKMKRMATKAISKFTLATFGTGFLHGLSPDAIFPVLPALTLSSKACAFAFVAAFLFGTVGSMASYTAFIGVGSSALAQRSPNITKKISMGSSAFALVLGAALLLGAVFGVDVLSIFGHA